MRWTEGTALAGAMGIAILAIAGSCAQPQTSQQATGTSREDLLERGRYLVAIGGCDDCHTPGTLFGAADTTRRLSGSELGWAGPWGTSYARNLTPDDETGIGKWSEEDIATALKIGQRPDKSPILPPMPWPTTAQMTDEDRRAVAAYLKTIPAVSHQVPAVVPPGVRAEGSVITFPAPSEWDARHLPPPPPGGN